MNRLYFFFLIISFFHIHSCDSGLSGEYISIEKFRDLKGRVVSDSIFFVRDNRDNGQLNLEVKFSVFLLDDNIDSIQLHFPGGSPEKVEQDLKPSISYDSYGPKSVNLVLSQIDTTYYNEVISYKNTIENDDYLNIVYRESNWGSYTKTNDSEWLVLPNQTSVILKEEEVEENMNAKVASAKFSGFEDKMIQGSIEYCVALKNPINVKVTRDNYFELWSDDDLLLKGPGFQNEECFTRNFTFEGKNEFDLKIKRYPALSTTNWKIATASASDTTSFDVYQVATEDELVGYVDVSSSTTVYLNFEQNGNEFNFGLGNSPSLLLDGDPITISSGQNKVVFSLLDGIPSSFKVFNNQNSIVPKTLLENEYYLTLTIKKLELEVLN